MWDELSSLWYSTNAILRTKSTFRALCKANSRNDFFFRKGLSAFIIILGALGFMLTGLNPSDTLPNESEL